MAVGDLYEVVDVQEAKGQEILNVYHYHQALPFEPFTRTRAQALAEDWADQFIPLIAAFQDVSLVHQVVRARNLYDPTDVGEAVVGVAGAGSSTEAMPTFNAIGMTLNHNNAAIRPGGKRYSGLLEGSQEEGVLSSGAVTQTQILADQLAQPMQAGVLVPVDVMFPVVVQRVREGDPGEYTYRLPVSPAEAVFGTVLEILVDVFVTSQVSRKIGVGA